MIKANAKSVAGRELPPIPTELKHDSEGNPPSCLALFYQYVEPIWTRKEHKAALKEILKIAKDNGICGRGRCAPEGLNCTLTGTHEGVRGFCMGLRKFNKVFNNTDFKLTDDLPHAQRFKVLAIRKVDELVNYGLHGEVAPSIQDFTGKHLEAHQYHKMLAKKDNNSVVIDVRNAYESAIGHFAPPEGGAELIDPKMRNSHDFAGWLNLPETLAKLNGKKVMMYCTGGIRCERATALLNQMTAVNPKFKTQGVYELRGGIERYMKTFPEGGFWKGKNYTFDRRMVQLPENKSEEALNADIESKCCVCRQPWDAYRGKLSCAKDMCGVPVIVCNSCLYTDPKQFRCELCIEGYVAPSYKPDLLTMKQKVEALKKQGKLITQADGDGKGKKRKGSEDDGDGKKKSKKDKKDKKDKKNKSKNGVEDDGSRIFVGRLPLVVNATQLKEAVCAAVDGDTEQVKLVKWLTDRTSGHFYGSAFVQMSSKEVAEQVIEAATGGNSKGVLLGKKKLKVNAAPLRDDEVWPPVDHEHRERPPI
jgi:predicted sulfurtransferase